MASGLRGQRLAVRGASMGLPTLTPPSPAGQCFDYCENEGICQMTASGAKQCRCPPQFEGVQCQDNKCSRCQEGKCSINKQSGEVSCM